MTKGRIVAVIVAAAVLGGVFWFYRRAQAGEAPAYRFATVERADIRATVAATGSLNAVNTVQVGTQVSGQISAIYVDFNDRVRRGQLLARIDPTLQRQAVADAQTGVERARAEYTAAKIEYDRNQQLLNERIITDSEFTTVKSTFLVADANLKSAQIALDRARQNLSYTAILAPIDGVIVSRDVDVGQTVAASLSAPQLFLIAQDLTDMQILAAVDESDIGRIADGQAVSFTVTSYPEETFTGHVQQVRLQSTTTENVVNYTVVIGMKNPEGRLLPGMTATVRFITDSATDVLTVPNAALRFQAPPSAVSAQRRAGAGAGAGGRARPGARPGARAGSGAGGRMETLWHLDSAGALAAIPVRVGLTDGQRTQVEGPGIREGMPVIVGTAAGAEPTSASNPFEPQAPAGGPRGPRGAF